MENEAKGDLSKLHSGNPHMKQMQPSFLEQSEHPSVIGVVSVVCDKGSLYLLCLQQMSIEPTLFKEGTQLHS